MWLCKKCNHKNNNSSEKCHGHNCDGIREKVAYEMPVQLIKKEKNTQRVYDHCQACGKDMFFTPTKWKGKKGYWRCESGKHRPCQLIGKTKPMPAEQEIQA